MMDQVGDKNDDKNWLDEIALKEAMNDLSDREKRIMGMRFFQGKTQMEVAAEIGISQAQVSRLEKCALDKIKKRFIKKTGGKLPPVFMYDCLYKFILLCYTNLNQNDITTCFIERMTDK